MNALCPPSECPYETARRHLDNPDPKVRQRAEDVLMESRDPAHIAALREHRHMRWSTPDSECRLPQFGSPTKPQAAPTVIPIVPTLVFLCFLAVAGIVGLILAAVVVRHVDERHNVVSVQSGLPAYIEWDGGR